MIDIRHIFTNSIKSHLDVVVEEEILKLGFLTEKPVFHFCQLVGQVFTSIVDIVGQFLMQLFKRGKGIDGTL